MKDIELRVTKGYCRVCEWSSSDKMVVIPFRYAGKNAPIYLCRDCVKNLNDVFSQEEVTLDEENSTTV